jgi:hypothetical protein
LKINNNEFKIFASALRHVPPNAWIVHSIVSEMAISTCCMGRSIPSHFICVDSKTVESLCDCCSYVVLRVAGFPIQGDAFPRFVLSTYGPGSKLTSRYSIFFEPRVVCKNQGMDKNIGVSVQPCYL